MAGLVSFQCPNCGSPIHTDGTQAQANCAYCGSSVVVPEELRVRPDPQPTFTSEPFSSTSFGSDFNGSTLDDSVSKTIGNAAKVATGVTVGVTAVSFVLPIVLTCVILGFVGGVLFFVFSTVNKATSSIPSDIPSFVTQAAYLTDTPEPTATQMVIDTPVPFKNVLLKDNFSNPSSGWDVSKSADYVLEYQKGKYHILINKRDGGQVVWLGSKYTDMSVQVSAQETAGPSDSDIGVTCRTTDAGNFYAFKFNMNNEYLIEKYTQWSGTVLAQGQLDSGSLSQQNQIEGVCNGSTLTLVLNGQPVLQTQDSDYTKGGVGLLVTAGDSGDPGADVLFSDFLAKGP